MHMTFTLSITSLHEHLIENSVLGYDSKALLHVFLSRLQFVIEFNDSFVFLEVAYILY